MNTNNISAEPDILLRRLRYLAFFAATFAMIIFSLYFMEFHGNLDSSQEKWGQFGDFIGGVLNPIFSLMALLALIATFSLQLKEFGILAAQRDESNNALKEQQLASRRQVFESSFYHLLSLHNDLLNGIDLNGANGNIKGRDCFHVFLKRLNHERSKNLEKNEIINFTTSYDRFYQDHRREIAHYFTLLFNIFKFIDNSDMADKKFYTNIIRAQLSSSEKAFLFYNCLTKNGVKFKDFVEKFSLLKEFTIKSHHDNELIKEYKISAFSGIYPELIENEKIRNIN